MTVATDALSPAPLEEPEEVRSRTRRYLVWFTAAFVLVAAVRVITGADDISSAGALRAALIAAIPIALTGLGGLWSERAGVVNIGLEGMMLMGCLGAGLFTYHYGILAGVLGAIAFGAVGGALHALTTVIFGVDHIVSGVGINIAALGITGFLAEVFFAGLPGGGRTQSPSLSRPPALTIEPIADAAADIAGKGWFLISDIAAVVVVLTRNLSLLTILALLLVVFTGWLLWRSPFGLRLRSCGENPSAAESLGVNVYRMKFIAVTVSGCMAGLAGAFLVLVSSSGYQNNMTGGLGYIGLAAMIFGNWRPAGLMIGASLFGYTRAVELRGGADSLHALLLLIAIVLVVMAVFQLRSANTRKGIVYAVIAVGFLAWFLLTDTVPPDFGSAAPYVTTLAVLAFASQNLRMPAADGLVYRRGSVG